MSLATLWLACASLAFTSQDPGPFEEVWNAYLAPEPALEVLSDLAEALEQDRTNLDKGGQAARIAALVALSALEPTSEDRRKRAVFAVRGYDLDEDIGRALAALTEQSLLRHGPQQAIQFGGVVLDGWSVSSPARSGLLYALAEAARMSGQFTRAEELLDELAQRPDAPVLPLQRARASLEMTLGRLDLAASHVKAARAALPEGRREWSVESLDLDLALLRQDFAGVLTGVADLEEHPDLSAWKRELQPYALAALLELVRDAPGDPAIAGNFRARFDELWKEPDLPQSTRASIGVLRADLELLAGDPEAALKALKALDGLGPEAAGGDGLLVPALRWEALLRSKAAPGELARAAEEVRRAHSQLLASWASTEIPSGGLAFLQLSRRTLLPSARLGVELHATGPDAAERALERLLEIQGLGSVARSRGAEAVDLAHLRARLLAPGRAALIVFPTHLRTHLFVVTHERVFHHERVSRDPLSRMAGKTSDALRNPRAPAPVDLDELSQALFPAELAAELEGTTELLGVGFDQVGDVPFATLRWSGKPLGEAYACSSLPSVPYGLLIPTHGRPAESALDLTAIVVPDPDSRKVTAFPFDEQRRKELRGPFERVNFVEGPAARLSSLRKQDFAHSKITLFLVHGDYERSRVEGAALWLEPEEDREQPQRLFAEDVRALEFGPLVILAACGAGKGPQRLGDDVLVNLGGAFLERGARVVILSRFPLLDAEVIRFVASLHAELARGATVAEAARRTLAGIDAPLEKFHASSFEVLGLGHERLFEAAR